MRSRRASRFLALAALALAGAWALGGHSYLQALWLLAAMAVVPILALRLPDRPMRPREFLAEAATELAGTALIRGLIAILRGIFQ